MDKETKALFKGLWVIAAVLVMIAGWSSGKPPILIGGLIGYGLIFVPCVVDAVEKKDIALLLCLIFIPVVGIFLAIGKDVENENTTTR